MNWYKDPQWMAIATALFLGVVGIFQDRVRSWFTKPKLDISISVEPPDCHKTFVRYKVSNGEIRQSDVYYLRFKVENEGNQKTDNVEVMLKKKYVYSEESGFEQDYNFLPLNLNWSHYGTPVMPTIAPNLFRHCDLGSIGASPYKDFLLSDVGISGDSETILNLDLTVRPYSGSHIVFPGKYRFEVVVSATNSKLKTKTFEIELNDVWYDGESEMLEQGVNITEV